MTPFPLALGSISWGFEQHHAAHASSAGCLGVCCPRGRTCALVFARRRNRPTAHFSERVPVVQWQIHRSSQGKLSLGRADMRGPVLSTMGTSDMVLRPPRRTFLPSEASALPLPLLTGWGWRLTGPLPQPRGTSGDSSVPTEQDPVAVCGYRPRSPPLSAASSSYPTFHPPADFSAPSNKA
uniref:Uncharacterized protein n=1 Tax=Rousettus aegyptiacus TaxID=9407 RepID=A0A7J8CIQ0_ROUAE|nr:hypothetical protein HJG63_009211 [Rousettus aegyptiacus]